MATAQNRVGWEATLYIWWAVSWRLVLAVFAIERLDETLAAIPGIMKSGGR
jgi:hypothetical protein